MSRSSTTIDAVGAVVREPDLRPSVGNRGRRITHGDQYGGVSIQLTAKLSDVVAELTDAEKKAIIADHCDIHFAVSLTDDAGGLIPSGSDASNESASMGHKPLPRPVLARLKALIR
jgi:hypothetical protein